MKISLWLWILPWVSRWSRLGIPNGRWVGAALLIWMQVGPTRAGVLAQWNFNAAGDTNHPAPSLGVGTATVLGGLNTQFSAGTGSSDPAGTNDLALSLAHFPAQGHGGRTAGVQFDVSTAGYRLTQLRFDLRATATSSRAGVVLVATDGVTFREVLPFFLATDGVFTTGITIPFEFFTGAADNPKFSVRIVSDYTSGTNYAAVKSGSTYSTSGTWRLDMVTFNADLILPPPEPPRITQAPQALDLEAGLGARFSVVATGAAPLAYQWFRSETPLPGETNAVLEFPAVGFTHAGRYGVQVSNAGGVTASDPFSLSVRMPTPPVVEFFSWLEKPQLPAAVHTNDVVEQVVRPGEGIHWVAVAHDAAGREMDWTHTSTVPDARLGWTVMESRPGYSRAEGVWHPGESDAGRLEQMALKASVRVPDRDPFGAEVPASTAAWSLYVPTLAERQLVLTEWLPSPSEEPGDNPLHRDHATTDPGRDDQFLEWVNWGGLPLDLSGWTLGTGLGSLHRFAAGTLMEPTNALVLFGTVSGAAPHLGVPAVPASEGLGIDSLFAKNVGLEVRNARSNLVQRLQLDRRGVPHAISMDWDPGSEPGYAPHPVLGTHRSSAGVRRDGASWVSVPSDPGSDSVEARAVLVPDTRIEIRWVPKPGVLYIVERSTSPGGPFAPVTAPTDSGWFADGLGPVGLNFYYRVRLP
jgi:hypothetical protein